MCGRPGADGRPAPAAGSDTGVTKRTLRAILAFGVIYVGLFLAGTLILTGESARAGLDVTALDAMGASATTLGNVGPGFGFAGPFGSFNPFSPFAKLVMILLMWAGRLEIIPVARRPKPLHTGIS